MQRRSFLTALTAAQVGALPAAAAPDRGSAKIKVTGIEIFTVHVNPRGNWVIVRVQTDAGLSGLGDASHSGRDDPAIGKLREYGDWLEGRSIYEIEALRRVGHADYKEHRRAASCAVSGLEQALYDIQGQAAGVPAYALFGGKLHDRVRNYANINRSTFERTPEGFVRSARKAIEDGFDAIKMASYDGMPRNGSAAEIAAHTEIGTDCIRAVRELIGPDRDLLVDAHSNFDLERGLRLLEELEPLNLFWLEEVSRPFDILAKINEAAPMPTAGGESLFGVAEFWPYLKAQTVDSIMPDVKYCGGMLELKKIAAMGEAAGHPVAPHGPASPVGNMAAAHVCASLPNFQILEFGHGETDWRAELVEPPETFEPGGMLAIPDRPGLGYKLNEKTARAHAAG